MTFALIANIILMVCVVVAIVGVLSRAIWTSRPEPIVRRATRRVAPRATRVPAYRSYEGVKA